LVHEAILSNINHNSISAMSNFTHQKKKLLSLLITFSLLVAQPVYAQSAQTQKAQPSFYKFNPSQYSNEMAVEAWNSPEGLRRLETSEYKNDFYELVNFFQPQMNPVYCGVASSVIILNAIGAKKSNLVSQKNLEIKKPFSIGGEVIPFTSYSQLTFLNEQTDKIKDRKIIRLENITDPNERFDPGLTLGQLENILEKVYNLKVKTHYASRVSKYQLNKFRDVIKRVFSEQDQYILANYNATAIGAKSGGHISPLVAYDQVSDSVLVLDVATHKEPWYWVKVEDFYKAMNSKDGKKHRGYLIISAKQ
jgi:hypothetical protein